MSTSRRGRVGEDDEGVSEASATPIVCHKPPVGGRPGRQNLPKLAGFSDGAAMSQSVVGNPPVPRTPVVTYLEMAPGSLLGATGINRRAVSYRPKEAVSRTLPISCLRTGSGAPNRGLHGPKKL
jgi:hypothetical protein